MTSSEDRLDPGTHARVFEERVVPKSKLLEKMSHDHPKAVILGGQPGAGKGGLARTARNELLGDVINIDPDELRDYHPRIREFRSAHPYTWSSHTQADASQWADELREAAVAGRKHFIFDTTLSNGSWSAELIRDLQAQGYDVEVRVVASPKLESELGVDKRFLDQLNIDGYGRHVPEGARDAIYDKVPASLDTIHAETTTPIRLFDREGRELYDSRTDARSPGQALIEAREARLHDPAITRSLKRSWQDQRLWHETLPEAITGNPKVAPDTARRLLIERDASRVVEDVQGNLSRITHVDYTTRVHPNVVKGLGFASAAAVVWDATTTARHTATLLQQGNPTGAASAVEHFGSRNLGMLGGALLGAQVLGAAGIESGPLDLIVAGVGGIGGAVAGDKLVNWHDQHKIHNQTDAQGHRWHHDPQHPEHGWTREVPNGEIGYAANHPVVGYGVMPTPGWRSVRADPALAAKLTFRANNTAVELALAHVGTPRDPYVQPAAAQDMPSRLAAPWRRDAGSGSWSRTITDAVLEHGLKSTHVEVATPSRRAELDAAAQATLAANLANSRRGIAERYQAIYATRGWQQYGAMPGAVTDALHAPTNTLEASDGHTYSRDANGQWSAPGRFWGRHVAEGNLRAELDATARLRSGAPTLDRPSSAARTPADAMPQPAAATTRAPATSDVPPIPPHLRDFRHHGHPMHANYDTMLRHVHALEDRVQMPHGDHSARAAAALVDRQSADRLGAAARIELRGEGRATTMHLVTRERSSTTYATVERTTPVSVFDAVARPVDTVSRYWSRRELPHLYQVQTREPQAPTRDSHTLEPCDPRHVDHPSHAWFDTLRERIGAAYARHGVERSAHQLDQAAAAVMFDVRKHHADENPPDEVRLLPDPHTGRIGPGSSVLTGNPQAFPPATTITPMQAMQQAPETAFRQLDQLAAQQLLQERAMQAPTRVQEALPMAR